MGQRVNCRAASVSERSEANDRGLFEISQYLYIYIYITSPAQVAQCQDHLGHKSIGAGCSNQMQVAQGQYLY